jgi:hypothetical protein
MVAPPRPSRTVSPGVRLERLAPGGKDGPNGEVREGILPGGPTWTDIILLGDGASSFQTLIPDIRLPPNQYWPLHWHDCWIGIFVLDGSCLIGDWWMEPGDVLVTAASLEYGPLLIGPQGCRMFEIFANQALHHGGYAPEFRDHPTLIGTASRFMERSVLNKRNEGRQCLPMDGVEGIVRGRLASGAEWDLGEPGDPDRSIMKGTRFAPGERLGAHGYDDWHAILVLDGEAEIGGQSLERDDMLVIEPSGRIDEMIAGRNGVHLFEVSRTAEGMVRRP